MPPEAARTDMMSQMDFTSGWFYCEWRIGQKVMCTVHAALRRRFFILLNSHDEL